MEEDFSSQHIPNLSVNDTPSAATCTDSPSVNRQIVVEGSQSCEGLFKQCSCEQIFDRNSNIKQLTLTTIYTAEGKPKGQDTWNVNFPALSDAANFISWQSKNIKSDKLLEPSLLRSSNNDFTTSSDIDVNEIMSAEDKSCNESIEKNIKPEIKLISSIEDKFKPTVRQFFRISTSQENNRIINEIPERKLVKPMNRSSRLKKFDPTRRSRRLRPLMPEEIVHTSESSSRCMKFLFFGLVGVIAAIVSSLWNEINENPFDFTNASIELRENIYGQDDAINQLIDHYRENVETFNVVVLVGGSGVGKSYTAQIIGKHFPHKHNIFEYSPPFENDRELAHNSLSSMHCNLVILEHLKLNHLTELVSFVKLLNNKKERCCAMILAIVNPEITNDNLTKTMDLERSLHEIDAAFSSENIPTKTISFGSLTSDIIDICINNEAQRNDIRLTDEQLQEVRRHLLLANSGCKGAYAKVQLYARI